MRHAGLRTAVILLWAFTTPFSTSAAAAIQTEQAKLLPSDGSSGDLFGLSVAISDDTAVIGAYRDDDNGSSSGSAYVFVRSGGVWSQQTKLLPSDGAQGDSFGFSVAVSGDTAVIGASGDDDNGSSSGSAYVFVRNGDVWSQQAKLLPTDGATEDYFGERVSVSGDTAVIGVLHDDDHGSNSGSAYVFVRTGVIWSQQTKFVPSDGSSGDGFGSSVAISGDTAVVGAYCDHDNDPCSGSAYVFVRNGGVWTQQAKLLASDGAWEDFFGMSIAVSGDSIVVGAPQNGDFSVGFGTAYVFVRSGGVWSQQAKLLPSEGTNGDFGDSVAISGDKVVVGAWAEAHDSISSGAADVFSRRGGIWSRQEKLLPSDGADRDSFGNSVAISGNTVLVGAPWDDDNGSSSGSAYVFTTLYRLPYSAESTFDHRCTQGNDVPPSHDEDHTRYALDFDTPNSPSQGVDPEPVLAARAGTAYIFDGCPDQDPLNCNGGYGNHVKIAHEGDIFTIYAHLKSISVRDGNSVLQGDQIGFEGSTGFSFGDHIHFGVQEGNPTVLDPGISVPIDQVEVIDQTAGTGVLVIRGDEFVCDDDAPAVVGHVYVSTNVLSSMFADGFESGDTSVWSSTVQ